MNREKKQPMVSVCMISYNHEKFIAKALDSILMQKVDFEYEIVVGEDCSTDNTRKILLSYYDKFPEKFKLIIQRTNVGMVKNDYDTLNACKGKYIAILEGDDFWTDEYKLQKQIDFLEANPDYGMVFSDLIIVDDNNEKLPAEIQNKFRVKVYEGDVFFILLKKGNFIYPITVCFRGEIIRDYLKKYKYKYLQDVFLFLIISSRSKIRYLNTVTGAYRRHGGNISAKPETIVGRKTWEYSVMRGIEYGLKSDNLNIIKEDFIYTLKYLIYKTYKTKYMYLKYLSIKNILALIIKYYLKKA